MNVRQKALEDLLQAARRMKGNPSEITEVERRVEEINKLWAVT